MYVLPEPSLSEIVAGSKETPLTATKKFPTLSGVEVADVSVPVFAVEAEAEPAAAPTVYHANVETILLTKSIAI